MIRRIAQHLRRISNARRFGVRFVRRATFQPPTEVRLNGQSVPVAFPGEQGVQNDFLTCFIEDEYGLNQVGCPVQTIVDIGANIGFFSMAARAYFPGAIIHAYEPNPRALSYSEKNAAAAQVTLFAEAVGSEPGFVYIEDTGDSNQAKTSSVAVSGARVAQVSLATVVERLGGRIDLAKIDCEGAEWDLFTETYAWAHIKHLRMEYHLWGRHSFAAVEQALKRIGFAIDLHNPSGEWGTVWAHNLNLG